MLRSGKLFAAIVALLLFMIPIGALGQNSGDSSAELPPGPAQSKATSACTECHDARIILQQRLGKPAWTKEVDKMIKWGALVDAADRDALIDYFSANFSSDKPDYEAQRASKKPTKMFLK